MLKNIIKKHSAKKIAADLNESIQTIVNWASRGVPMGKARQFCAAVNFDITPHDLYPDQYPHPNDGLPDGFQKQATKTAAQ